MDFLPDRDRGVLRENAQIALCELGRLRTGHRENIARVFSDLKENFIGVFSDWKCPSFGAFAKPKGHFTKGLLEIY